MARSFGSLYVTVGGQPVDRRGWVNVDLLDGERDADVVAGEALPFRRGCFESVYLAQTLACLSMWQATALLQDVSRVLAPGGALLVVDVDVRAAAAWVQQRRMGVATFFELLEDDWASLAVTHRWWNCYEERVVRAVELAGFNETFGVDPASLNTRRWPVAEEDTVGWLCAVYARAPKADVADGVEEEDDHAEVDA